MLLVTEILECAQNRFSYATEMGVQRTCIISTGNPFLIGAVVMKAGFVTNNYVMSSKCLVNSFLLNHQIQGNTSPCISERVRVFMDYLKNQV